MKYEKIYNKLIQRARVRVKDSNTYYENHHIIPSCLGGPDTKDNKVPLTFREHYICHWLLTKIYTGSQDAKSLASAFWKMAQSSGNQKRDLSSRQFERCRQHYMDNHPMKDPIIAKRARDAIKLKWQDPEFQALQKEKRLERALKNNPNYLEDIKIVAKACECGCGETFEVEARSPRKYILGHQPQDSELLSKIKKEQLSKMSKEELAERMKNSVGKCDQVKRGNAISTGKKGKKTNQQQIMGERYAAMSDEKFAAFLAKQKPMMHKRSTNLRNKYLQAR